MPALSVTDWTLLAILIPALALFYVLLVFVKHYRNAWLRMIAICSYIAAIILTAVQIIMVAFVPESAAQILILFNCAGQLIAATGIIESIQFLHCIIYLRAQKKTNWMYIKIWLGCVVVGLIPYAFAVTMLIPLHAYRILSCFSIGTETILYCIIMYKIWNAKNVTAALIYYGTTITCRIGILAGVILRLLGTSVVVVNIIHYTSVVSTGLSILMLTRLFRKAIHVAKSSMNLSVAKIKNRGSIFSRPSSLHSSKGDLRHTRAISTGPLEGRNMSMHSRVDTWQKRKLSTGDVIDEAAEQNVVSKIQTEMKAAVACI